MTAFVSIQICKGQEVIESYDRPGPAGTQHRMNYFIVEFFKPVASGGSL